MAAVSNIPRDLQESIKDLLDKQVKVTLKKLIKFEARPDKIENRVLALSGCRLFILTAKVPSRLETSFNFLEIQSIESKKANQLTLVAEGKTYQFYSDGSTEDVNHIITHIGISLKQIFTSYPLERLIMKIEVQPPERLKPMYDLIRGIEKKDSGPCGGFTTMYQCTCDYQGLPYREEVAWDVDTIYLSHDCRELRLQDFDHLSGKDLIPIIGALEHNSWFKRINASNVKLTVEACSELIKVMKRNSVIEDVNLSATGIKLEFVQKFALAIISNSGSQLNSLDLSNNLLDDKAIQHLLGAITKLPCGLTYFDISKTGITTKCLNKVAEVLAQSPNVLPTLTTLKLNDNGLKGEEFPALYNFLAQPNVITHLDLSFTDCALDSLCDPLLRGCPNLAILKASRTVFTHKKTKDVIIPQSWKQLFASSCCLEHVDFSYCKLPSEAVKELLLGLSSNRGLKDLCLDISNNELGSPGASVITCCIASVSAIKSLDVSNNGFDADLKAMFVELAKNTHLKSLSVGRNFSNIKPKAMTEVMNALALLLQEENSVLESLSLAESKLKADTTYVINALGSNNALQEIDISGNAIGDLGARMLAKALLINSKLRTVVWDKNNVSTFGFEDVAEALQRNVTLKKMPYPINDAAQALRLYPERTEAALQKIESCLQRNNSPRRFASDQAYRLQQGFLISSTQQNVDRLIVQVEDTIAALRSFGTTDAYAQEIETAEKLLSDANKSKMLLPGLQDIGITSQSTGNPIDNEFNVMMGRLTQVIETHMKKTTEDMLKCTGSHCPAIMNNQTFQNAIKDGCQAKSVLPKDFSKHVLEGASADVYNLTSEINLAVAALISDRVIEEIIDSMTSCQKSLGNHLNLRRSGVLKDKEKVDESDRQVKSSVSGENSPELANKRKTLISRKTRPQSAMGDDVIAQTSKRSLPAMSERNEETLSKSSEDTLNEISRLASSSSRPLEHVTKARPRREKAHRPTRPIVNTGTTELEEAPTNGPLFVRQPSQPIISVPATREDDAIPSAASKAETKPKADESSSKTDKKRLGFKTPKVKEEKDKDQKDSKKSSSFGFSNIFKKKSDKKKSFDEGKAEAELPTEPVVTSAPAKQLEKEKPLETVKERTVVVEESPTMKMAEPAVNNGEHGADEKLPTSPRAPKSALLPPSKVKAPTLAAEEDFSLGVEDSKKRAHGEDERKDEVSKLPAGVVKMPGLGALGGKNLLHEMKATQEKRFSKFPPSTVEEDRKKEVKAPEEKKRDSQEDKLKTPGVDEDRNKDLKPAPEANNNISLRHLEPADVSRSRPSSSEEHENKDHNDSSGHTSVLRPLTKPSAPPPPSKPALIPKARFGSTRPVSTFEEGDEVEDIPKSMTTSTPDYLFANSSLSATSTRPTPPVKPRPILPKPRRSGTGAEDADIESSSPPSTPSSATSLSAPPTIITTSEVTANDSYGSSKTEPTAPASGVVYDSATLRLTVKDKIKRLSKNNETSESSGSAAPVVPTPSTEVENGSENAAEEVRKSLNAKESIKVEGRVSKELKSPTEEELDDVPSTKGPSQPADDEIMV
ncbi:unnamed protein product [Lymnaea stagnalis]|uniref:F-actin-uncapping protein LRRC16A n=1 Tax=Lymnaea stagnalis TaxID=6523 RepID=A0AAV2IGE6_LYMST